MKRIIAILLAVVLAFGSTVAAAAHSGRTDSAGGHKDNKNASGLGYYHYHHGMGPHLHPDGVCPYTTSNSTSQTQSSTKPSSLSASVSSSAPTIPNNSFTSAENSILQQAKQILSQGYTALTLQNPKELSLPLLNALTQTASDYSKKITLHCETILNGKMVVRISFNTALASSGILVEAAVDGKQVEETKADFSMWFNAPIAIVVFTQSKEFGCPVEILANLDLSSLNIKELVVYSFDRQANTITLISPENCSVDENGTLHVRTSLAGELIVTDRFL